MTSINNRKTVIVLLLVVFTTIVIYYKYILVNTRMNIRDIKRNNINNNVFKDEIEKPVDETNITCYDVIIEDDLPSAETVVVPTNRSIFFIETTCRGYLTARQACSVESASRSHNDWTIYVLFLSPVTKTDLSKLSMAHISKLHNVKVLRIHLNSYALGTSLQENIIRGDLNKTKWKIIEASDIVRLLTLYKWGGIYMDLDVVIVKPLDQLGVNWAVRESTWSVTNGIISLSRDALGQRVSEDAIKNITFYKEAKWGHNGPSLMTSVLKRLCGNSKPDLMNAEVCGGFKVYSPEYFYPVSWSNWKKYFNPGEVLSNFSYGYHVWNHMSSGYKVHKESPYAKLANQFCPTIYNMFKNSF